MRGLFKLFIGMVFGAILAVEVMNYHVIRTESSWGFVPKRYAALSGTYFDTRGWTLTDWTRHPDLVWTLYQNERQDLIPGREGRLASLEKLFEK